MNVQFYIAENGQQKGPFTLDELRYHNINRNTLIWTEGLDGWTRAEYIPMLKDLMRGTPPPVPPSEKINEIPKFEMPPVEPEIKYFGYKLASVWDRFFANLIETVILIGFGILVWGREFIEDLDSNDDYSFESLFYSLIGGAILGMILYPIWSGNLGHKIMGLKVISSKDGGNIDNALSGAVREGLKHLLQIFIIPAVILIWDKKNQNLYDMIVNTLVVKKR
jgi:uncharacterized RDD family membrane protein YckC